MNGHSNWERFLKSGTEQISLLSSRRKEQRSREQASQPHLSLWEGNGENLPESISKYMKDKKVMGSSQQGFTKGRTCLTNLITFYNDMTSLVDKGRAVDTIYLDFSKAFDISSYNIIIDKLTKYGLEKWTVRWIKS